MRLRAIPTATALAVLLAACEYRPADGHGARHDSTASTTAALPADTAGGEVDVSFSTDTLAANDVAATPEALGDTTWRTAAEADRALRHPPGAPAAPLPHPAATADTESLAALTPERVNARPTRPALGGEGATVLRAQLLLDQAGFSPGAIDGRWGANVSRAAYWFQDAHGLPVSGFVDAATFARLAEVVGGRPAVVAYAVTPRDLAGPFVPLAASPYDQARQPCLCYASAWEQLAERFHTTRELLARLNPGVDTTRLAAGTRLWVPNVEILGALPLVSDPRSVRLANATGPMNVSAGHDAMRPPAPGERATRRSGPGTAVTPEDSTLTDSVDAAHGAPTPRRNEATVARIVVSRAGGYLHAFDAAGQLVYHAPSTLGTRARDATPDRGALRVTRVIRYPSFHYDPRLYADVSDTRPDARLPAGPNSPVGVAWLALSRPHFGIHGTESPGTIGYTSSHGCVRLTNWDVAWLAEHTPLGTVVEFVP